MFRRALSALLALLAGVAILSGFRSEARPANGDFAQGAYAILLRAEDALREGRYAEARAAFYAAYLRAVKYGKPGVENRIRNRMAGAGMDLCGRGVAEGWEFLALYALWSDSFGTNSARVEDWYLREVGSAERFTYILVRGDARTAWGDYGRKVPLWFLFRLPKLLEDRDRLRGLAGPLYFTKIEEIPKGFRGATVFALRPTRPDSPAAESVCVLSGRGGDSTWFVSYDDRVRWDRPLRPTAEGPDCMALPEKKYTELDRLVLLFNGRQPPFVATAEHRYQDLWGGAEDGGQNEGAPGGVTR